MLPWRPALVRCVFGFCVGQLILGAVVLWLLKDWLILSLIAMSFILSSLYCMWWLNSGCALLCGSEMSKWAGFGLRQVEADFLRQYVLQSRWADFRYRSSFIAQIDYLSSLSKQSINWTRSTLNVPFEGGTLSPWSVDRQDECLGILRDEELMRWHALQSQEASVAKRIVNYAGVLDEHRSFWSYMLLNEKQEVCGHVELRMVGQCGRVAELSFGLHAAFRRRGYMSSALHALISYWREVGEPRDYVARTKSTNRACISLLESLGFRQESSYPHIGELGPITKDTMLFVLERDDELAG